MIYRVKTEGMGCPHCIMRVTNAINALGAAVRNMELNDFTVDYSGDSETLREAIEDLGFDVVSIENI
ncbi:MAG: heavy-metal-associated domain-containing protein [Clostridia bacterium]|nr:heavy-metal-associated domain-containing protein [Clostridia bacterium]